MSGEPNVSARIEAEWLGLRQVTHYTSVSERTVREWIHAPIDPLPGVRAGGKLLVKKTDLDTWLLRRRMNHLEAVDRDGIVRDVLQGVAHGR